MRKYEDIYKAKCLLFYDLHQTYQSKNKYKVFEVILRLRIPCYDRLEYEQMSMCDKSKRSRFRFSQICFLFWPVVVNLGTVAFEPTNKLIGRFKNAQRQKRKQQTDTYLSTVVSKIETSCSDGCFSSILALYYLHTKQEQQNKKILTRKLFRNKLKKNTTGREREKNADVDLAEFSNYRWRFYL